MSNDDAMLEYIKSIDISLRELNQSYKSLNDKVDEHINNDNNRIGVLEKAAAVSNGIKSDRRRMADKSSQFMTVVVSLLISSAVALTAAWIDKK